MQPEVWNFLVALRKELLGVITGIEDAKQPYYWDNTTPNSTTRSRLKATFSDSARKVASFGVYVVTLHGECGRRGHRGYLRGDLYGLGVNYRDECHVEFERWLEGEVRLERCPCSVKNEPRLHWVAGDIIYNRKHDLVLCRKIGTILSDLGAAIGMAADNRPRAAIREYLLRAIIQLNDAIMPTTVDQYIAQQQADR